MNGQELATAAQYGADIARARGRQRQLRHDPHAPGARISGADLGHRAGNPDFAALARAYGGWAETVETTEDFAPALDRALARAGRPAAPLKTDVEQISNATTITKIRERAKR